MTTEKQRYNEIVHEVAKQLELPDEVVDKTYRAFWRFVKTTLAELPLKTSLSEEEFNKLRTSVNIPSLGKIYCSWDHYNRLQKRLTYINYLKKEQ